MYTTTDLRRFSLVNSRVQVLMHLTHDGHLIVECSEEDDVLLCTYKTPAKNLVRLMDRTQEALEGLADMDEVFFKFTSSDRWDSTRHNLTEYEEVGYSPRRPEIEEYLDYSTYMRQQGWGL